MTESNIQKEIMEYLTLRGYLVWRNNSGGKKIGKYYIHMAPEGSPDIIGIQPVTGKFIGVEVKKPDGKTEKKRAEKQRLFSENIQKLGGIAIIAYCVEDVEHALV